jgi:hypothetical protein
VKRGCDLLILKNNIKRSQPSVARGVAYTRDKLVGCQAVFAGKPRSYKKPSAYTRPSPLNRPSVSSPAAFDLAFDLDLPAPSGG